MKEFYELTVSQTLRELETQKDGLLTSQVFDRSLESKRHQIREEKRDGFFKKFLMQIKDLMVMVLLISAVVSIIVGATEKSSSEIVDGAIILGIVAMNATFGVYQERKSEKAIESLKKLTRPEAFVVRDGKTLKVKAEDIVFGDVVVLSAGSIVPADLRLISTNNFKVNEASLTGESKAVEKDENFICGEKTPVSERKNIAFCGCVVESGSATGVVIKIGDQTEIGKIAKSLKETKRELTPLQNDIQKVGKILTYLILFIAGVTFVLETIFNPGEILVAFLTAVSISVAAIPESLPAVITIIMSLGVAKLSKERAIVKKLNAVETLGACDIICSDKTGTITQNKMKVEKIFSFGGEDKLMLLNMALCNNARLGTSGYVGSSTEVALLEFAKKSGVKKEKIDFECKRFDENPFDSGRKMMSTCNFVDEKKICFTKGALDKILPRCKFYVCKGKVILLTENAKKKILNENKKMCDEALRVMAFACKISDRCDESELVFQGLCGICDPPRKEIFDAVKTCKKAGMRAIMITGDFKNTALAVAKKVGIAESEKDVVSGEEIDSFSDEMFVKIVEQKSVFARVTPEHKARIVETLRKNGHTVAMTGDGVNDAPSMKKADIGIGMGKTGTDVTKDVADILITDDNFATIVVAVKEGRKIYNNIQKTIKYLFSANMAEILALFFITILLPGKTFLLPVQILFVNLITDSLPAVALGVEPVETNIMDEKPRDKNKGLLSSGGGTSILILGSFQTILTLFSYFFGLYFGGEKTAITMAFYTLNLIQLFYMFTARTNQSCFKSNPFKNKLFLVAFLAGMTTLCIIAFSGARDILKLEKLNLMCWLVVFALSLSIVLIGEFYKKVEEKVLKRRKLHFE